MSVASTSQPNGGLNPTTTCIALAILAVGSAALLPLHIGLQTILPLCVFAALVVSKASLVTQGLVGAATVMMISQAFGVLPAFLMRLPEAWIPPTAELLDTFFDWIKGDREEGRFGLIYITRWFAEGPLEFMLRIPATLLEGKSLTIYQGPFQWFIVTVIAGVIGYGVGGWKMLLVAVFLFVWAAVFGQLPWSCVAAVAAVIGYYLGGWKLAALAGGTFVWTALIGQWEWAMQTLSVLAVAAPLAFVIGLGLGIAAWKYAWVDAAIKPILAVLQTIPFFTYLLPAVIFFKVGPTAGAIATTIYAIPPMVLMSTLGLKKVSPEIVEAGNMSGCTRWQMLTKVYIPSARTDILVGVNQVIMLCLAMVVLTAFIGMPGLGGKLLSSMGSFKLGRSFEIGVTIVLVAVMLDRLSKAWVVKLPEHFEKGTPWYIQHKYLVLSLLVFAGFLVLAQVSEWFMEIGRRQSFSQGRELDKIIKDALAVGWVKALTEQIRYVMNVWILIPFRNALLWIPTPAFILLVVTFAWVVGGKRPAVYAGVFFSIVALSGWWDRSVITLYSVISAVILSMFIGIPLGIFASRSEKWANRMLLVCDTAQTFPSFIYLLPAIMLFGVSDVTVVLSIVIFTTVPLTRYTIEGLRNVPPEMTEAADMSGATKRQKLLTVQIPLALPTMAVGFNQAIMFAFFMVIIAAFIGTQDLGQELQRTLAGTDLGKNFVLGMNVALMALTFDLAIISWANRRKKALGLA